MNFLYQIYSLFLSDPVWSCLLHDIWFFLLLKVLHEIWISLWYNNFLYQISNPVYSCLFLFIPVCFFMLEFHIWDLNFFTLEIHILDWNSLNVWISYMISEFLFERGKKKCWKYIKNRERKKRGKEKIKVDTWRTPLFLLYFSFIFFLFL